MTNLLGYYEKHPIYIWDDLPKEGEYVSITDLSKITGLIRRDMDAFMSQIPKNEKTMLEKEHMLTWNGARLLMCAMEDSKMYSYNKVSRIHPFLQWWIDQTEQ